MRVWTNTTFRALDLLAGPEPAAEGIPAGSDVGHLLGRAVAEGAVATLTRLDPGHRRLTMDARLERAGANSLTIGRPGYRPGQRALAAGERLEIRIGTPEGCYLGETQVIAKFAPDGDGGKTIAYRLSQPSILILDDRRGQERIGLTYAEPPQAEIFCAPRHKPLGSGHVVDLAAGGLRIRATDANVRAGDRVVVRAKLSEDIRLHAIGIVVHASGRDDGTTDVGVRFPTEQPDIERFIRFVSSVRSAQQTARPAR